MNSIKVDTLEYRVAWAICETESPGSAEVKLGPLEEVDRNGPRALHQRPIYPEKDKYLRKAREYIAVFRLLQGDQSSATGPTTPT